MVTPSASSAYLIDTSTFLLPFYISMFNEWKEGAVSMNWARNVHASSESKLAFAFIISYLRVARQLDSHNNYSNCEV